MVRILSIDVGIKNLAYCILDSDPSGNHIIEWDIINIMENINPTCVNILKNKPCTKDAYFIIKSLKKTKLNNNVSNNVSNISSSGVQYFCNKKTCMKKMESIYTKKQIKKCKRKTCKNIKLQELAIKLLKKLQTTFDFVNNKNILNIDTVIIENQPVLKNPTMKSVQMILYTYFLEHGFMCEKSNISTIILFSPRNKLKTYDGPTVECTLKNKYSKRKFLSIEYTKYFIIDTTKWYDFFLSHSKKDDLADCYMQGLYYLTYTIKK